jgi:hypothetical protein
MALVSHAPLPAQDCGTVVKHIDLGGDETVWNSATSLDGSVYLCGTLSRPFGTQGAFVVKTTDNGTVLWSRVIPAGGQQLFRRVQATADSGAITVGLSSTLPASARFSGIVVKWDKNGNRQWSKSFSTNSANGDWALGVIQTSDGGYLLTGNQNSAGFQASGYALKMDALGNAQWIKRYAYPEGIDFQGAIETSDGYVVSGEYLFNGNSTYYGLIVKLSKANGSVLSAKGLITNGPLICNGALKKRPGGFYFNGTVLDKVTAVGGFQHVALKISDNLNFESAHLIKHGTRKNTALADLVTTGDGGFVGALGGENSSDDADMYRLNSSGAIVWRARLGGAGAQQLSSTSLLPNGDAVFGGNTTSTAGVKNIVWIRLGTSQAPTACVTDASDATVESPVVTETAISFTSVTDIPFSNWVTINPAIESDGFSTVFSCGSVCENTLDCNNWLFSPNNYDGAYSGDLDVTGNKLTVEGLLIRTAPYVYGQDASNVVSKHDRPADVNYLLRESGGLITTTNGFFATPPVCPISINKTYHVAMVYDGSTLKFYRNGKLESQIEATGNLITNNYPVTIGDKAGFRPSNENVRGYIDEVRIWNVARSEAEINSNFNKTLTDAPAQVGLLAYYTFDNLLNKQGNPQWNLVLQGGSSINATNPQCQVSTENCPTLPLLLKNFQCTVDARSMAKLTFTTLDENNVDLINIEKSPNGTGFTKIGFVPAKGRSYNQYQFLDPVSLSPNGIIYYRLEIVDKDDSKRYSKILAVSLANPNQIQIAVSPNPSNGASIKSRWKPARSAASRAVP